MGETSKLTFILCSCFLVFTINIVVLVIGVYVNKGGSLYYGNLIRIETEDWNRAPIVSLMNPLNNAKCPDDTETITGTFLGVNPRCNYLDGSYRVGTCRRKEGFYNSYGMNPVEFSRFDNLTICAKRDKSMDYHQLAKMRSKTCMSNSQRCGSLNETDRQFCVPQSSIMGNPVCPPNGLNVKKSNGSESGWINIGKNMSYAMNSNESNKNPISEIIYSISPPCSNLALDYVARPVLINPLIRDRPQCARTYGDPVEHPLFYPTSFGVTELSVYQQNGNLLKDIISNMKNYVEKDFIQNNYSMFYRTYAKWTTDCQNAFSTEDLGNLGQQTSSYSKLSYSIMVHSIILYVVLTIGCAASAMLICTTPIILGIYISLLIHYCIAFSRMNNVDLALLRYAAQYQCSEGPLQQALEMFEPEFTKDLRIVKVGLSFTIIGITFFTLLILCTTPLKDCCLNCCAQRTGFERMRTLTGKPALETYLESRLERMRGGVKAGLIARLRARGAQLPQDGQTGTNPPPAVGLQGILAQHQGPPPPVNQYPQFPPHEGTEVPPQVADPVDKNNQDNVIEGLPQNSERSGIQDETKPNNYV